MKYLPIIILLAFTAPVSAQDFLFSQFYAVPMSLNAAATGHIETGNQRITTAYRGQWDDSRASEGAYQGAWVSYEYRHCQKHNFWAAGVQMQAEGTRFARYEQLQARLSGAFHYRLSRHGLYAAVGGGGGVLQYGAQLDGLRYDNQFVSGIGYDPTRGSGENFTDSNPSEMAADLNAGAQVYHAEGGWGGGVAFLHLNQPQFSLLGQKNFLGIGLAMHGTGTIWLKKSKRSAVVLRGLCVRQSLSGANSRQWQGLVGGFWKMTSKGGGVFAPGCMLRATGREKTAGGSGPLAVVESLIPTVQVGSQRARLGLSYDFNVQRLTVPSAGRVELTLTWAFGQEDKCVLCNEF